MTGTTATTEDPYNRLLQEMPHIAEVVNAFHSEVVQKSAYDALVTAIGAPVAPVLHTVDAAAPTGTEKVESKQTTDDETKGRRRRGKAAKKSFSPVKNLNFAPAGKPTLADFISEKVPRTLYERNLVACYYLSEMMGVESVDVNHVLAVFRAAGWDASPSPDVSLRKTASVTGWIDTSKSTDIKVVWEGDEYIVSKMPVLAKKDAA